MFKTISGTLLSAFIGVIVALSAIVATALFALQSVGSQLQQTSVGGIAQLNQLSLLESVAQQRAVNVRDLAINEVMLVQKSLLQDSTRLQQRQVQVLEDLGKAARSDEDRRNHATLAALASRTDAVLAEVARAVDEARIDEVKPLVLDKVRPQQQALGAELQRLIAERSAAAQADATTTLAGIGRTVIGLLMALAAVALAACGVSVLVSRNITDQLGGEPREAMATARAIAGGDLSQRFVIRRGGGESLMAALDDMQQALVAVVARVRAASESVSGASVEIAQGNHDLSTRTGQQAGALQETSAAMEQLESTVRATADNARQANALAANASKVAAEGGAVVDQVVDTMKGINQSSSRIADIIGVIDGIAFQTNILALNAAVEAARAGEQGRGFAVVASEVRVLAHRSAEAAREIKTLISTSVEQTDRGSAMVDRAGATMSEVVAAIARVAEIMREISTAASEQDKGVAQVGQAITQMDQATQQNAALVEQGTAASQSLKQQADQLAQAVAVFKLPHAA